MLVGTVIDKLIVQFDEEPIAWCDPPESTDRKGDGMENNSMGQGQDSLWLFYLLLNGGYGGGRGMHGQGYGNYGGGGAGPYTDFSLFQQWSNTVDKDNFFQAQQGNHAAMDNLSREINQSHATTQTAICSLNTAIERSNGDVKQAIADCCCKTQTTMLKGFGDIEKEILRGNAGLDKTLCQNRFDMQMGLQTLGTQTQAGFCDVQRSISEQTHVLAAQMNNDTQRIIDVVDKHANAETQDKLTEARSALSNCQQTGNISQIIKETVSACCSNNSNGHH